MDKAGNGMIGCVLVDDEKNALEMMEWLLKTYCPEVHILSMCSSGEEGIAAIRKYKPDVVFLDIDMPKMTGFDMLGQFEKISFDIVFCTAYDQFAVRAFKYCALNYLLKPVDPGDLKNTVNRILEKKAVITREQFETFVNHLRYPLSATPQKIALTTSDGLLFVPAQDILYCEASSNYTTVVLTQNRKVVVSKVLKDLDDTLSGPDFCRVHHSYLINLNRIKKFVRGDGGYVIMEDDATVSVSRNRRQEFMDMFAKF